jgi:hypothetical protein
VVYKAKLQWLAQRPNTLFVEAKQKPGLTLGPDAGRSMKSLSPGCVVFNADMRKGPVDGNSWRKILGRLA